MRPGGFLDMALEGAKIGVMVGGAFMGAFAVTFFCLAILSLVVN